MTTMAVEVHGSGEPIVMLHGLGGSSNVFGAQVGVLARFFQCIRPDLPGSGRSPVPARLSIGSLVDEVMSLISERDLRAIHLVGHSLGTILCQHIAVRHPDLVRSLVLIGPITAPPPTARTALRERAALARSQGMVPVADAVSIAATSAQTKASKPELVALFRDMLMSQNAEGYALTCEALSEAEPAAAADISCPALLIAGDEDLTAPLASVWALARRIRGSRVHVVGRSGHLPLLEHAGQVSTALLEFFSAQT